MVTASLPLVLFLHQGSVAAKLIFHDAFAAVNASCGDCTDCTDCVRDCTTCPWRTSTTGTPPTHSTRTIAPCPTGRTGSCITFDVKYYPPEHPGAKTGACYRSELAGAKAQPGFNSLEYGEEFWFGFSLRLPDAYSLGTCGAALAGHCNLDEIHFQVHGSPNRDLHEPSRNPVFALELGPDPNSVSNMSWHVVARGDPKLNLSYHVNPKGPSYPPVPDYEWQNQSAIGAAHGGCATPCQARLTARWALADTHWRCAGSGKTLSTTRGTRTTRRASSRCGGAAAR